MPTNDESAQFLPDAAFLLLAERVAKLIGEKFATEQTHG